jgi:hypothetical protein
MFRADACENTRGSNMALYVRDMDIPESMREELGAWNNGAGIELESWIGCEGRFALAVGYATLFWPEFVEFDGYILRKGFSETSLRGFESQPGATRKGTEWVMNHLHISDTHAYGCSDASRDKIMLLGTTLKDIYETKLRALFPTRPCIVEFHVPEDPEHLVEYQLSFWQATHETRNV